MKAFNPDKDHSTLMGQGKPKLLQDGRLYDMQGNPWDPEAVLPEPEIPPVPVTVTGPKAVPSPQSAAARNNSTRTKSKGKKGKK